MRSFWTKIDALEAWHAKLVDKPWLQPVKPTKFMIALILLSTLVAARYELVCPALAISGVGTKPGDFLS